MVKLLSLLTIVVFLVLFPPATLAFVSQNALPGDSLYPVKRALEEGVLIASGINPTTRAWFSAARAMRRYREVRGLISKGEKKAAAKSLKELIEQTSFTIDQVQLIKDSGKKKQLAADLIKSIDEYRVGLIEVRQEVVQSQRVTSTPTPSPYQTTPPPSPPASEPTPSSASPLTSSTPSQQEDNDLTEGLDEANDQLEKQRRRAEEALRLAAFEVNSSGGDSEDENENGDGDEDEDEDEPIDPGDEQIDSRGWQGVFNRLFEGRGENSQRENKSNKGGED